MAFQSHNATQKGGKRRQRKRKLSLSMWEWFNQLCLRNKSPAKSLGIKVLWSFLVVGHTDVQNWESLRCQSYPKDICYRIWVLKLHFTLTIATSNLPMHIFKNLFSFLIQNVLLSPPLFILIISWLFINQLCNHYW